MANIRRQFRTALASRGMDTGIAKQFPKTTQRAKPTTPLPPSGSERRQKTLAAAKTAFGSRFPKGF